MFLDLVTTVQSSSMPSGSFGNHFSETKRHTFSSPYVAPSRRASGMTCLLAKAVTATRRQLGLANASPTICTRATDFPAPAAARSRILS